MSFKPHRYDSPEVRFWMGVRSSKAGCWEWCKARDERGYGFIYVNGCNVRTHRYSWEIHHGEIPVGLFVCHHCDNPRCVRPDHLFVGTHKDNMQDAKKKGRLYVPPKGAPLHKNRGERNGGSRVIEEQVKAMRKERKEGCKLRDLARK